MNESKHWWETVPGILGGIAAIIVAIGGLLTVLNKESTAQPAASITPPICEPRFFSAQEYSSAKNIGVGTLAGYGNVITNGGDGSKDQENMVEFSFTAASTCMYRLDIEYAAAIARPVVISFNSTIINQNGLSESTGGWGMDSQKVFPQGTLATKVGINTLQLYRASIFPHIKTIHLVPSLH